MQTRIREFIREYNRRYEATVLLTSHYMADIAALCQRVIIIHHGRVMFDGELDAWSGMIAPFKVFHVAWDGPIAEEQAQGFGEVSPLTAKAPLKVPKDETPGGDVPAPDRAPGPRSYHRGSAHRGRDRPVFQQGVGP